VKETSEVPVRRLALALHSLHVQNELLHHENEGLREALAMKQKHAKNCKPLDLQQRKEYWGGAVFWSPRKLREAKARAAVEQQEKEEKRLRKAEDNKLKKAALLFKTKQQKTTKNNKKQQRSCEEMLQQRARRTRTRRLRNAMLRRRRNSRKKTLQPRKNPPIQ
jgi:hypothetical protein